MSGICYIKNKERGIWFEKQCLQEIVDSTTAPDKDKVKAKEIIKAWQKLTEEEYAASIKQA